MSKKLIFMDCETTGVDPSVDQILSITMASVDARSGELLEKKSVKIAYRGDTPINPEAIAVHRINPLKHKGLLETDAAKEIGDFFERNGGESTPIAGYNVNFDAKFVRSLLTRSGQNGKCVSLQKMDLYDSSTKMISEDRFPVQGLTEKQYTDRLTGEKKTRRSLTQGSVAKALKIEVDPSRLHDDSYDVDTSIEVWKRLGRPQAPRKSFTDPYELQKKHAGQVVEVREWDHKTASVVSKRYYVTGEGAGVQDPQFKDRTDHKTIVIPMSGPDFQDAIRRLHAERKARAEDRVLKQGGLGVTAVGKVASEWGYDRTKVFSITAQDMSESEQADIQELSSYVIDHVSATRIESKLNSYLVKQRAIEIDFKLNQPDDNRTVLNQHSEELIPEIAKKMQNMTHAQRVDYLSGVANVEGNGSVWAYTVWKMAHRYGYRNRMPGFEDSRLETLSEMMPKNAKLVDLEKGLADLGPGRDALEKAGYRKVKFLSSGEGIEVLFFPRNFNAEAKRLYFANFTDSTGKVVKPRAKTVSDGIQALLSCSAKEAGDIRKGFTGYVDSTSFPAVRASFARKIKELESAGDIDAAAVLRDTLKSMGRDHDTFIKRSVDPSLIQEIGESSPQENLEKPLSKEEGSALSAYIFNAERVRDEIRKGYKSLPGHDLDELQTADMADILAANLNNPATAKIKELDALARSHDIDLTEGVHASEGISGSGARFADDRGQDSSSESDDLEVGELGQKTYFKVATSKPTSVELGDGGVRCKVCNRAVRDENAVAGMGPTCARRLLKFISNETNSSVDVRDLEFRKLSQLDSSGRYPIMIVRDKSSGKCFAADIVKKEVDGRYLVVDLSEIARRTQEGGFSPLKDAARVYLDEENYEVAKVMPEPPSPKKKKKGA